MAQLLEGPIPPEPRPQDEELLMLPRRRIRRQPGQPPGNKNSFVFFCENNYKRVREENPDMSHRERMRLVAQQWRQLPHAEQDRYKYEQN